MTFGDAYINHVTVLQNVGMTSIEPVVHNGVEIIPLQFLKTVLPDPGEEGEEGRGTRPARRQWKLPARLNVGVEIGAARADPRRLASPAPARAGDPGFTTRPEIEGLARFDFETGCGPGDVRGNDHLQGGPVAVGERTRRTIRVGAGHQAEDEQDHGGRGSLPHPPFSSPR